MNIALSIITGIIGALVVVGGTLLAWWSQYRYRNKLLCYFRRPNGQMAEKWMPMAAKHVEFEGGRYHIAPEAITIRWYDKGFNKLLPTFVSTLSFSRDSAVPLASELVEAEGKTLSYQEEFRLKLQKSSEPWAEYHNNLDGLLGVKTRMGLSENEPLTLRTEIGELSMKREYDWFIVDKIQDKNIFKIVGLNKKNACNNCLYLLGREDEFRKPFLKRLPIEAFEKSCEECLSENVGGESNGLMVDLIRTVIGIAMLPALMEGIVDGANTKGGNQ